MKYMNTAEKVVSSTFKWYAIMCVPNKEKSIIKNIKREVELAGLSKYVDNVLSPTQKEVIIKDGKKVTKDKTLISGYIFLNIDISNGELIPTIRRTRDVMGWLNLTDGRLSRYPEELNTRQVEQFLNISKVEHEFDYTFKENDKVKIVNGAFNTFEATVKKLYPNKKTLDVLVEIFGRVSEMELKYEDVIKIDVK